MITQAGRLIATAQPMRDRDGCFLQIPGLLEHPVCRRFTNYPGESRYVTVTAPGGAGDDPAMHDLQAALANLWIGGYRRWIWPDGIFVDTVCLQRKHSLEHLQERVLRIFKRHLGWDQLPHVVAAQQPIRAAVPKVVSELSGWSDRSLVLCVNQPLTTVDFAVDRGKLSLFSGISRDDAEIEALAGRFSSVPGLNDYFHVAHDRVVLHLKDDADRQAAQDSAISHLCAVLGWQPSNLPIIEVNMPLYEPEP